MNALFYQPYNVFYCKYAHKNEKFEYIYENKIHETHAISHSSSSSLGIGKI